MQAKRKVLWEINLTFYVINNNKIWCNGSKLSIYKKKRGQFGPVVLGTKSAILKELKEIY